MTNVLMILKPQYTALEHFRQMTPHEYMCEIDPEIHVKAWQTDGTIDGLSDEELKEFQIVQFIRHIDIRGKTKDAIDRCHRLGLKVVFDIDDYWIADKDHALAEKMRKNNYQQTCTEAITFSDWVTTTTPYFADKITPLNKNVTILPNCISPLDKQWGRREIKNSRIRFGWVGGMFHLPDVMLLSSAMDRLNRPFSGINEDQYQVSIAGWNPSEEYIGMEKVITSEWKAIRRRDPEYFNYLNACTPAMEHISYDKPYRRIWTKPVKEYGQVYNEIDVALVPLRNTDFNRCKSELKIIEAGTMGKAVICSDVTPYKEHIIDGENGLLASNWFDEMKYILENPDHQKEMAEALSETIRTKFDPKKIQTERAQLYKQLAA